MSSSIKIFSIQIFQFQQLFLLIHHTLHTYNFPIHLIFSILITKYYIYLFSKIINASFNLLEFNHLQLIITLIISLLLLIKKTRNKVKNLYLIYYLFNFSIYWTINTYSLNISNTFIKDNYINNFISNNLNFNYINIVFLFLLEILFFLWSFIVHKDNLSDWRIPIPKKSNLYPLVNIFLFYFGLIVYFYMFKNIFLQCRKILFTSFWIF